MARSGAAWGSAWGLLPLSARLREDRHQLSDQGDIGTELLASGQLTPPQQPQRGIVFARPNDIDPKLGISANTEELGENVVLSTCRDLLNDGPAPADHLRQ